MLIATVNNRSDHALRASFADRLHNSNRIAIAAAEVVRDRGVEYCGRYARGETAL